MAQSPWLGPALGWAIAGLLASLPLRAGLLRHAYRYVDELDVPARRHWWVVAALPAAAFAIAARWALTLPTVPALLVTTAYCATLPLLAALAAIDLDVHRLPDRLTRPLTLGCAVAVTGSSAAIGDWSALYRAALAAAALAAAYRIVLWCSPSGTGLGFGDVKLAPALGLLLGWVSWPAVATGTLLAFVAGGLWAAYLLLTRRARGSDRFAFGPFMIMGALTAIVLEG